MKANSIKSKTIKNVEAPWKNLEIEYREFKIETAFGSIFVVDNGIEDKQKNKLVVLMHACPSSLDEQLHYFPCYTYYGYRVIAFDMPGFGNSSGNRFLSRSDQILNKGGPADCALAILDHLGYKKAIFGGYDWGAGIAISLAKKYPKKVKFVIALLPSYNPKTLNDMKTIQAKILVMWVKQDQMHSWSHWKKYAVALPNKTIELFDLKMYKRDCSSSSYQKISDKQCRVISMFLGHPDPFKAKLTSEKEYFNKGVDTDGKIFDKRQLIVFQDEMDTANLVELEGINLHT